MTARDLPPGPGETLTDATTDTRETERACDCDDAAREEQEMRT